MLQKINNIYIGLIAGILIPAILYFIFIYPKISHYSSLDGYYYKMVMKLLPLFLTRCIFPNAILFFLLVWKNLLQAAKGILISTAALTAILVIINFVL
jgi:hypothetical protein